MRCGAVVRRCGGAAMRRDSVAAWQQRGGAAVQRGGVVAVRRCGGSHRSLEPVRVERVAEAGLVRLQRHGDRLAASEAHLTVVQVEGRLEQYHLPRARQPRHAQLSS